MGRRSLTQDTASLLEHCFGQRPFTAPDAEAVGITRSRLKQAVGAGLVASARRGLFFVAAVMPASEPDPLDAARAVCHGLPRSALSHSSAARSLGLPIPGSIPDLGHVTQPQSRARRVGSVRVHSGLLPPGHTRGWQGLVVTTPARTAIDLARTVAFPEGLICMDAVLRGHVDHSRRDSVTLRLAVHDPDAVASARQAVQHTIDDMRGWRGIRRAQAALEAADPAAESPLESESRGVLIEHGLPRPTCGFPIEGADGVVYWVDMAWDEQRVIGECDGRGKYTDPQVLYREKWRQEALERAGWKVVRWMYDDLRRRPTQVARRVRDALSR